MAAFAAEGLRPSPQPRTNSHIHLPPNFSAFETVAQAADLAAAQGVGVLGLSNYYDYRVYGEFLDLAVPRRIYPLLGLEIIGLIDDLVRSKVKVNDPGNPGRIYICGKGVTRLEPMTPRASELIATIRRNDASRMAEMAGKLTAIFRSHGVDIDLDAAGIIGQVVQRHHCPADSVVLQERHLAKAFQEAFFARLPAPQRTAKLGEIFGAASKAPPEDGVKIQNEIRSHLMKSGKPAFVSEAFLTFAQALELIGQLGGIPCYPTLADGASPICPFETPVDKLIAELKKNGIFMAELIPIRNQPDVLVQYVKAMRAANIVVVGGTEHNTLDLLALEPACLAQAPVPGEIKDLFWEGACVVAAHQFLTLHGQCGFVDGGGKLNPAYPDDDARIRAFARLGAAVIERYYQRAKMKN